MNKKLPLVELRINPELDSFIGAIALVNQPAIESDFLFFSKNTALAFKADDDKQELIGYAMIPNMHIYRRDDNGYEYNVFFTQETIKLAAQTYFKKGFQHNLNIQHTTLPAKSYIYQSYLVDTAKGINAPKGLDSVDGGWIIGVKVEDKSVWEAIKEGKMNGFSIEGLFQSFQANMINDISEEDEILQLLNKIHNKLQTLKT